MEQHWTIRDDEAEVSHDNLLGQGGFGEVHKMTNTTTGKILRLWAGNTHKEIGNEANKVRKLCQSSHPNIVQVLQLGQLKPDSVFHYIDMELCDFTLEKYIYGQDVPHLANWAGIRSGSLESRIAEITGFADHIIKGLIFIHELGEVHRDLSPQNVLYSFESKSWKIADFGLTSEATSSRLVTSRYGRGKPGYRAPELISEQSGYNNKTDMWALGCIIGELITGTKTFSGDYAVIQYSMYSTTKSWSLENVRSESGKVLLEAFFVTSLLSRDAHKRPSAKQLGSLYQIPMFLLQSGVSITKGDYKATALGALSRTDQMDLALALVKAVIASGVNFDKSPTLLKSTLELSVSAASQRHKKLMNTLLKASNVDVRSTVFEAVYKGDVDAVQFMLASGADVGEWNWDGETLLHCAALAGHVEVLKLLLDFGANMHAEAWNRNTPLHYTAVGGNPDVVKVLLAAGAEVRTVGGKGLTSSNLAALNGHVEVLKLLLPRTGREFNGVISDHYDSEWVERYQWTWERQMRSLQPQLNAWELYQLPLPFKRVGDDWSALFNKDSPTNLRISLVLSCRFGSLQEISCVCFSKDGGYVAAAALGRKVIKIFEIQSGAEIASLVEDTPLYPYNCICFGTGSGGKDIIMAGKSKCIDIWDISSQSVTGCLVCHDCKTLEVPRVGPSYLSRYGLRAEW